MRPIVTDSADRASVTATAVVERLYELDRQGVPVVAARSVFEHLGKPAAFNAALNSAVAAGRLSLRRVRLPGGTRRRFVALPRNARHLAGGGAWRSR